MAKNNKWTKEQTIVAFNIYCKIPFKKSRASHPEIIKYAKIIGRSPAALNMKIGNFGRLDPELKKQNISGLKNGSKLEEVVWEEFHGNWETLAYKSELLLAQFLNKSVEESADIKMDDLPVGKERETIIKKRVNQRFFRAAILSAYTNKCCVTGLSVPDLLIASHIIPWSKNEKERLNPRNGLCLNAIHDRAFDKGYITISSDYKVIVSKYLRDLEKEKAVSDFFYHYEKKEISLPERFFPDASFLEYHREEIFERHDPI